jgi:hypothetical protein
MLNEITFPKEEANQVSYDSSHHITSHHDTGTEGNTNTTNEAGDD